MQSTFQCLKVSPFNLLSVDAREIDQKLHDQVPSFDPSYFRKLDFTQELVSVFRLSKFHEVIVSTFVM